jgi:hypothetical protein
MEPGAVTRLTRLATTGSCEWTPHIIAAVLDELGISRPFTARMLS